MIDIVTIATGLEPGTDGIWYSKQRSAISYPEEGNQNCLALEEDSFWFKHRNRCIQAVMQRCPSPGILLDVGGGNGYVAHGLQQAGIAVALLEPGIHGIQNARQRGVQTLICSTLEDAGFQPGSLPGVGMFDVLEHIQDDCSMLRMVNDLLIPGGRIYLSVPAYGLLWATEDDHAGHFRRYTLNGLARKLDSCGFRVTFASYIFSLLPLPIFLLRAIPSRLKLNRQYAWNRYQQQHKPRAGVAGGLLARWLAWEQTRLQNGQPIPFGGSCLITAQKDSSSASRQSR